MPLMGFSHYNLRAPRPLIDELCAFYCEVVGLTVGARPPFRRYGFWLYAGSHAVLHLSECAAGEARPAGHGPGFDHAAFDCQGRGAIERVLAERGIAFESAQMPQSGRTQLFFRDPGGNGVELNFARGDL